MAISVAADSKGTLVVYSPTNRLSPEGTRPLVGILDEHEHEQELIPRPHEDQRRERGDRRPRQGQHDSSQRGER